MSQERIRLTLVQDNPMAGDTRANADLAIDFIQQHKSSDLLVFSECFVSGYPVGDLVLRPGFIAEVEEAIDKIRRFVIDLGGPAVLIGAPYAGADLPYNAAYLIEPTGAMRVVRKRELPNSDVFDERRTFASAIHEPAKPLTFMGFRLGVQICEDMWHGQVSRSLADELADVLLVINGSPYERGKHQLRIRNARARVRDTGLPLIYVNQIGGQDELVFDGASFLISSDDQVWTAQAFCKDALHVDLVRQEDGAVEVINGADPLSHPYPSNPVEADYEACVLGLREYIRKTGNEEAIIGVSGGLDSAVVLTMAVDAIGAENVTGVMMPGAFTSSESLTLADDLMQRLGVRKITLPIAEQFAAVDKAATQAVEKISASVPGQDIARENFQARIRGLHLMGLSNALGGLVISTGNKSEMSVGYATLYGDMCGGFNPLKSVYKTGVFAMARWRNEVSSDVIRNPIPEGIITRPPSAELAAGQADENSLGPYPVLDHVLVSLIEMRLDARSAAARLVREFGEGELGKTPVVEDTTAYVERIAHLVRRAQFKREQSPPGVKLNPTDFGLGWRYPIAGNYSL